MQADDEVVVVGHRRVVVLGAARYAFQSPPAWVDHFGLDAELLAQDAGEHALAAGDVGYVAGGGEAVGQKPRHDIEPRRVAVEPITAQQLCLRIALVVDPVDQPLHRLSRR